MSAEILILVPPSIGGSKDVSYPEIVVNGTITLVCPAFGIPSPTVSWYVDGVSLHGKILVSLRCVDYLHIHSLYIH